MTACPHERQGGHSAWRVLACTAVLLFAMAAAAAGSGEGGGDAVIIPVDYPTGSRLYLHVLVPAGTGTDAGFPPGTALLTARMLERGGTLSLSAGETNRAKARLGLRMRIWEDGEFFHLAASMPGRNRYAGIRLVADLLFNPAFEEDALAALLRNRRESRSPLSRLSRFERFFLDRSPALLTAPRGGAAGTKVLADAIRRFHAERFVTANTIVSVANRGDLAGATRDVRGALYGFEEGSRVSLPRPRIAGSGPASLCVHGTGPGRATVTAGVVDPGPGAAGWDRWVAAAYGMEEWVAALLEREEYGVPRSPWLEATYLASGRILFKATLQVEEARAARAAELLVQGMKNALAAGAGHVATATGEVNPSPSDVLARYCIDRAFGHPESVTAGWLSAVRHASPRAWRALLVPPGGRQSASLAHRKPK